MSSSAISDANLLAEIELGAKQHAACDECRLRKTKCSGEPNGCGRCAKQGIVCNYSEQKQMGRPRKKQKTDHGPVQLQTPPMACQPIPRPTPYPQTRTRYQSPPETGDHLPAQEPPIDPSLATIQQEQTEFANICNGPIAQSIRDSAGSNSFSQQAPIPRLATRAQSNGLDHAMPIPMQYPLDISQWPDYSTLNALPVPIQTAHLSTAESFSPYPMSSGGTGVSSADPDINPAALSALPVAPACTCLANLYLTLSTLSTLSSFPVSCHTVETLLAAHRTAHGVIYCSVCPRKFQTGSQNLMLGCTLLNVLADQWHRVKRSSTETLKKGFTASQAFPSDLDFPSSNFISGREGKLWRTFSHELIRAYVFGDMPVPIPPSNLSSPPTPPGADRSDTIPTEGSGSNPPVNIKEKKTIPREHTLLFVIKALQRRQRQWHNFDEPTDEFPDRCSEGYSYHNKHHKILGIHGMGDSTTKIGPRSRVKPATKAAYCKVHGTTHNRQVSQKGQANGSKNSGDVVTSGTEGENIPENGNSHDLGTECDNEEVQEQEREVEEEEGEDDEAEFKAKESASDHAVCLMIVKYSLDIVRSLDDEEDDGG